MPGLRRTTATLGAIASIAAAGVIAVLTTAAPVTAAPAVGNPKIPQPDCCSGRILRPGSEMNTTDDVVARTLVGATLPPGPGSAHGETYTPYSLVLQTDGNLVEYQTDAAGRQDLAWQTGTSTATRLVFQTDHNVVLRDAAGRALWASGTAGSAATYFGPYGNGQVVTQDATGRVLSAVGPGVTAVPGVQFGSASSPGRRYSLVLQTDGNLVEYDFADRDHPKAVWSSRTVGYGQGVRLIVQQDGNLVLRRLIDSRAVWQSGSHGPAAYYQLDVQDDRNVVLYRTDGVHRLNAVWSTRTAV